jgi:peptidoglycan/LPS O-acetylase OafA/YrhL
MMHNAFNLHSLITQLLSFFAKLFSGYYVAYDNFYSTVLSFTYISIATLLLLPCLSNYKSAKGYVAKIATFISLISYSIYLLHITVLHFITYENMPWNQWLANSDFLPALQYIAYWAITIFCSWLLYRFWEVKMTNLRDKMKRFFNLILTNSIQEYVL